MAQVVDEEDGSVYNDDDVIYSPRVVSSKARGFQTRKKDYQPLGDALRRWERLPEIQEGEEL